VTTMLFQIKKRSRRIFYVAVAFLMTLLNGCVEPFETEGIVEDFKSVLVVEAALTNELKQHQIRLTRAFEFEADSARAEQNANVSVIDDQGRRFQFSEGEPGVYLSDGVFEAESGDRNYSLSITTSDGKGYASDPVELTTQNPIGNIEAARITNENGNEGMAILVNSFDPTNTSNLYRYEYEETFLIIAPDWTNTDLVKTVPDDIEDCQVNLVFTGDNNERICYGSTSSNTIILANTSGLDEDRVSQLRLRFINRDNAILTHRYSILVRQFIQSPEAHTFYTRLRELSQSDNLFSQIQTGLLVGNIFSEANADEIVLGYFEVASVSEERIFFNYDDFFPGEDLPPYFIDCDRSAPPLLLPFGFGCGLSQLVETESVEYFGPNRGEFVAAPFVPVGPHIVVPAPCGDCTRIGSNIRPSFWVD